MTRSVAAATAVLAGLVAAQPGARAEMAFLCEGGRIVYASDATIEKLKREDACIAGYYGLKVEGGAVAVVSAGGPAAATSDQSADKKDVLVELRPSSAIEIARLPKSTARRRFHEIAEPAHSEPGAAPQALKVINAGAVEAGN